MRTAKSYLQAMYVKKYYPEISTQVITMSRAYKLMFLILSTFMIATSFTETVSAQNKNQYIRVARIVVDSAQLDNYKAALKEGVETAVQREPGVITLYAVYDINSPTHVTVFEIYADMDAYKLHIQTPHFLKYKSTVKDMVKSLELIDVMPIALAAKGK